MIQPMSLAKVTVWIVKIHSRWAYVECTILLISKLMEIRVILQTSGDIPEIRPNLRGVSEIYQ